MSKLHIQWNSIRVKLVISVLVVTVPLIALLFYNNYYAIHVVRDQVAHSNKNMLSLYMREIDNGLEDVNKYLVSLVSSDMDVQIMDLPQNSDDYILSKSRLSAKLSNNILIYKTDAFFVYSIAEDDLMDVADGRIDLSEKETVRKFIRDGVRSDPEWGAIRNPNWFTVTIGGKFYLMRMMLVGDILVGSWVRADSITLPLSLIHFGEKGGSLLLRSDGNVMIRTSQVHTEGIDFRQDMSGYYLSGSKDQYLVVGERSQTADFTLVALIPNSVILQNLPYLNRVVFLISALGIVLLPGFLLFLRKALLIPLRRIEAVMKRIGEGNFKFRIEPYPTSNEFKLVNSTFNRMMAQIEELKISVYEEQLNKQKAELQHLQLQINPHFFMNTLSIIYNLALTRSYETIKEMSLLLVQYFRYMFRSNLTFVPLMEELEHVRNYARIHELRFQQDLKFEIHVSGDMDKVHIPPLIIQTFVENATKHAVSLDRSLRIAVDIRMEDSLPEPYLQIRIRDNGKGFKEEVLRELREGNRVVDEQGEHIGIWNAWHRMRLLYGSKARLDFSNEESGGAVVIIRLPFQPETKEAEPRTVKEEWA
jgi:Predicted signal transduction protein with a C-terminal ATPase domain